MNDATSGERSYSPTVWYCPSCDRLHEPPVCGGGE
jgi:hypothetical protein